MQPLGDGEVDIWLTEPASIGESSTGVLEAMLSPEERERATAFHFARDRRDYVVSHVLLRVTLSQYAQGDPATLAFTSSAAGRPALVAAPSWLDFSLSHTDGLAAVAVSCSAAVGVDAEDLEQSSAQWELADRYFAADEARALRALPEGLRPTRFLELWTLKEAYAKARGSGLSLPLDRVPFTLTPGNPPSASFAPELGDERGKWQFALLRPTARHVLAVARSGSAPLRPRLLTLANESLWRPAAQRAAASYSRHDRSQASAAASSRSAAAR